MGRVFYARNILPHELEAYEADGWTEAGRKYYCVDDVSILVTREGERETPFTTRDIVKWNFAPWDLVCAIGIALAGLAWGVMDRIRGNK